jgi:hypothetical protein
MAIGAAVIMRRQPSDARREAARHPTLDSGPPDGGHARRAAQGRWRRLLQAFLSIVEPWERLGVHRSERPIFARASEAVDPVWVFHLPQR